MQLLILFISLFSFVVSPVTEAPVDNGSKTDKVTIKTSANCGMCKVTIEKALYALEGVKKAELDLVTKNVKVKYDVTKLDATTLRQAISAAGYAADDVPARPKAVEALPECCKPKTKACAKDGKKSGCCASKKVGA